MATDPTDTIRRRAWTELLVQQGLVRPEDVDRAQARASEQGGTLGEVLVSLGLAGRTNVVEAVADYLGLPIASDSEVMAAPRTLARHLPRLTARRHRVVPYALRGDTLRVALFDADTAEDAIRDVRASPLVVDWAVASEAAVEAALARLYPAPAPGGPRVEEPPQEEISNTDFGLALGLEPGAEASAGEPVLLFRRKPDPSPLLLTRRKGAAAEAPRVEGLGAAADRFMAATSLPELAQGLATALASYFPRCVVLDLFRAPAAVLATRGCFGEVRVRDVHRLPGIAVMLTEPVPYYGVAPDEPSWTGFAGSLGPGTPRTMLVMPVYQDEHARLMVYADTPAEDRLEDTRDFQALAREAAAAASEHGLW